VIHVVVDDLAFVQADAVVRPATASLEPGAPTRTQLEQASGSRFGEQSTMRAPPAVGSATDAAAIVCDVRKTPVRGYTFPSDIRIVVQSQDDKDALESLLHMEER